MSFNYTAGNPPQRATANLSTNARPARAKATLAQFATQLLRTIAKERATWIAGKVSEKVQHLDDFGSDRKFAHESLVRTSPHKLGKGRFALDVIVVFTLFPIEAFDQNNIDALLFKLRFKCYAHASSLFTNRCSMSLKES
jgi:hypothetical protein